MAAATDPTPPPHHPSSSSSDAQHHQDHRHPNRDFAAWRARLSARLAALGPEQVPVVLVACGSFNPPTRAHLRLFAAGAATVDGAKARGSNGDGGGDDAAAQGSDDTLAVVGGLLSPVGDGYGKAGLAPAPHRLAMCALATREVAAATTAERALDDRIADICVHGWEATREGGKVHTRTLDVLRYIERELNDDGDQGKGPTKTTTTTTATPPPPRPSRPRRIRAMLLAGTDLVESMRRPGVWSEPDSLLREHGVVCVERPGHGVAAAAPNGEPSAVDEALIASCVLHAECEEEFMTGVSSSRAREALRVALAGDEGKGTTEAATPASAERARAAASDPRVADLLGPRVAEYAALHGLY